MLKILRAEGKVGEWVPVPGGKSNLKNACEEMHKTLSQATKKRQGRGTGFTRRRRGGITGEHAGGKPGWKFKF